MFQLPPGALFVHRNVANLVNALDMTVQAVIQFAGVSLRAVTVCVLALLLVVVVVIVVIIVAVVMGFPPFRGVPAAVSTPPVEKLHIEHIIVCGHYDCGGVRASLKREDFGTIDLWLRNIRDVSRLHKVGDSSRALLASLVALRASALTDDVRCGWPLQDELFEIKDEEDRVKRLVELNVMEQCINVMKIGARCRAGMDVCVCVSVTGCSAALAVTTARVCLLLCRLCSEAPEGNRRVPTVLAAPCSRTRVLTGRRPPEAPRRQLW
jgi:carbonic anhydrase